MEAINYNKELNRITYHNLIEIQAQFKIALALLSTKAPIN